MNDVEEETSRYSGSRLSEFSLPSIASSLKEVYFAGSIPLALIFIAAVVIFYLLVKGVISAIPFVSYLIGLLVGAGVIVFLVMNWLAYKQWNDEVNARLENRRMEIDLYLKLSSSARDTQDTFLLNVLKYTGDLSSKPNSTPEGRNQEIKSLSESLGLVVKEFVDIRAKLELPELTSAFPERKSSKSTEQQYSQKHG